MNKKSGDLVSHDLLTCYLCRNATGCIQMQDIGTCLFDGESEELNGGSNLGNQEVEIALPQSILGEETAHSNNDNGNVIAFPTNCCT